MILALSGHPASASETYYRWVAEDGTPVSSDRPPPPGVKYEVITTETNTSVPVAAEEPDIAGASGNGSATESGDGAASQPRIVAEKNPEACSIAKQNLETLNTHARIRMPDGEGSYRYLNEDEKAAQRAQAEAAIKQNCD